MRYLAWFEEVIPNWRLKYRPKTRYDFELTDSTIPIIPACRLLSTHTIDRGSTELSINRLPVTTTLSPTANVLHHIIRGCILIRCWICFASVVICNLNFTQSAALPIQTATGRSSAGSYPFRKSPFGSSPYQCPFTVSGITTGVPTLRSWYSISRRE